MKYSVLLAALTLGACQQSAAPAPEATDTAAAEAAAAATTAAAAPAGDTFTAGQPPSEAFMIGTWGEGDACELPITFAPGGKITDGPVPTWTLANGELVMGGEIKLKLTVVDHDTMQSLAEGSTETRTLKRCG